MGTQLFDKASDEAAYTLQRRLRLVGYCVPTATLLLKAASIGHVCARLACSCPSMPDRLPLYSLLPDRYGVFHGASKRRPSQSVTVRVADGQRELKLIVAIVRHYLVTETAGASGLERSVNIHNHDSCSRDNIVYQLISSSEQWAPGSLANNSCTKGKALALISMPRP